MTGPNLDINLYQASYETLIKSFPTYENLSHVDDVNISDELIDLYSRFAEIHRSLCEKVMNHFEDDLYKLSYTKECVKSWFDADEDNKKLLSIELNLFPNDIPDYRNTDYLNNVIEKTFLEISARSSLAVWTFNDIDELISFIDPEYFESVLNKHLAGYNDPMVTYIFNQIAREDKWALQQEVYNKDHILENISKGYYAGYVTTLINIFKNIILSINRQTEYMRNYIKYDADKPIFNEKKVYKLIQDISFIITIDMAMLNCVSKAWYNYQSLMRDWYYAAKNTAEKIIIE